MEFTQADLDRARTEGNAAGKAEGIELGRADGIAQGRLEERSRIGAILGADEAKGREPAARQLALATDMPADAVKGVLAALPQASSLAERAGTVPHSSAAADPKSAAEADAGWADVIATLNKQVAKA